jgi:xylose isomerase
MRTYLILREKVRRFHDDVEIADAMETARRHQIAEPTSPGGLGTDALADLRASAAASEQDTLAAYGYGHERLDQLVTELLLGVR